MEPNIERTPAVAPQSSSFFTGAQGFSIGNQYNVGQQIVELKAEQVTLNPIPDASYSRNRRVSPPDSNCLPGTREDLIKKVAKWADSSLLVKKNGHIMWLYGYVGCGKSAIAQAVAEKFAEKRRLAASFFFFRGSGDRSKAARFAATIASQVAAAIPTTAPLIQAALKAEIGLLEPTASLRTQYQRLVFEPIKATKWDRMGWNRLRGPYLIVLDGLDECDDKEEIAAFIEHTIDFFNKNPRLPLRFLISSRVEEHIRTRLKSNEQVQMVNLVDHTTREDIMIALQAAFAHAARHSRVLEAYGEWPSPKDLGQLVDHIDGSFIFMSTIVKFVLDTTDDGLTPKTRLPLALDMNPGLDGLYTQTLMRSHHLPYSYDVIWTLSMLKEPLSIVELAYILEIETFEVIAVLVNLHSIFQVPGDDTTPVAFCHTSLRDFLDSEARSKVFKTPPHHYERLGYRCLEIAASADQRSPAFPYATKHWEAHWRNVAQSVRHDKQSRGRQTAELISRLRGTFPPHCLDVLATYILINRNLLLAENIVCDTDRQPNHTITNNSVLENLLRPIAPAEHVTFIVKAMNMLAPMDRRWDNPSELECIWLSVTPPLPPLASFHEQLSYRCIEIVASDDERSPAFPYATKHWEEHWRNVTQGVRHDKQSRGRQAAKLISRLRGTFPPHCLDVLATYILINPNLLLDEKIVCNTNRQPIHTTTDDSVLGDLLSPIAPAEQVTLIVKAMNMLRPTDQHWDDSFELEQIWLSVTPPLPPLASFHHIILSIATDKLFMSQPFLSTSSIHKMGYHGDSQIPPLVFGLVFMSWPEHLALALQHDPPLEWASLNEVSGTDSLHQYAFKFGYMDTIFSRIILHLARAQSDRERGIFISNIKSAVRSVAATEPPHSASVEEREHLWAWQYDCGTGWYFETHMINYTPSLLDILVAFSVLAKCLEGNCRLDYWSHPSGCPLQRSTADAADPLPDSQEESPYSSII